MHRESLNLYNLIYAALNWPGRTLQHFRRARVRVALDVDLGGREHTCVGEDGDELTVIEHPDHQPCLQIVR